MTVISGGQTGVDRAGLDAALTAGLPIAGWCPRDRRAEDGPVPERYPLTEINTHFYQERTRRNVRDSDATLILLSGEPDRGTALTIDLATRMHRPLLVLEPAPDPTSAALRARLDAWAAGIRTLRWLNIAGPRASRAPELGALVRAMLTPWFRELAARAGPEARPVPWPPPRAPRPGRAATPSPLPGLDDPAP